MRRAPNVADRLAARFAARLAAPLAAAPLAAGCGTDEVAQAWQIDRLRVLAVAAEPAEPRPGDTVTFRSLTVSPAAGWSYTAWVACLDPQDTDLGCSLDPDLIEEVQADGEIDADEIAALQEAGLVGVEPFLPPTWTVPEDALDGLDEDAALEGLTAFVNLAAFPEMAEGEELDEGDVELAYKRVPVSLATTPNHNPALVGVRLDGVDVPVGTRVAVDVGQSYAVEAVLADDAVEDYTYRNDAGEDETRTEEPYFTWYLQEGTFDQTATLYPTTEVTWTAPESPELAEQSLWVVVRDRRGGMAWQEVPLALR